jgi:hypothetical protein
MENILRIGKAFLPLQQIAMFEPFVTTPNMQLNTLKEFKSRIVLRDRTSILSEDAPEDLGSKHSFRLITEDCVAINPTILFRVESFAPAENFQPSKPFQSRLVWRDGEGNTQSKLMLTTPETLLAIAVRGRSPEEAPVSEERAPPVRRSRQRRSRAADQKPA